MKFKLLLCLIALSSCTAYHHGSISGQSGINVSYSVVDFAQGYAKVNRFLFFGGVNRDALVADAKRNLLMNYQLKKGQFFANYIVDFKQTFYFYGVNTTMATITAEVMSEEDSDFLEKMRGEISKEDDKYLVGQKVFYIKSTSNYIPARVLAFRSEEVIGKTGKTKIVNRIVISYLDNQNRYRVKQVSSYKIATENKSEVK